MFNKAALILCLILFTSLYCFASGPDKANYSVLLEWVKQFDRSVDFAELRFAYAETPAYDPYHVDNDKNEMHRYLIEKQFQKALDLALSILERKYVDIEAHMVCTISYLYLKNPEKEKFHRFVCEELITSILKSGDGKSFETAFQVIAVGEEYTILRFLGLKPGIQSLMETEGHSYDRLEAKYPQTGENRVLYFNVDKPINSLRR